VEAVDREAVAEGLRGAIAELDGLRQRAAWGKRVRDGAVVVLTGEANVGKSSLFNALLEDDRALVSGTPGTTRDYLEAWIDVDGVPVRLVDTAGLREAASEVEAEGVRRARKLREEADVCLRVIDVSGPGDGRAAAEEDEVASRDGGRAVLVVGNKSDLLGTVVGAGSDAGAGAAVAADVDVLVSARTGDGIAALRKRLGEHLAGTGAQWDADEALPGERHAEAIRRALRSLGLADAAWRDGVTEEWIAGEVRDAAEALGEITGRTVSEEVLDRIFSRFCIGK
jgi:tRNA modification GTPase